MLDIQFSTKAINNLQRRLKSFLGKNDSVFREDTEELAKKAVESLTEYPSEGKGNYPPAPYWERGTGLVGGQGRLLRPSMKYGNSAERWEYITTIQNNEMVTTAKSPTEMVYAPYVGDPHMQTRFHRDAGWKTTDAVVIEVERERQGSLRNILNRVVKAIDL